MLPWGVMQWTLHQSVFWESLAWVAQIVPVRHRGWCIVRFHGASDFPLSESCTTETFTIVALSQVQQTRARMNRKKTNVNII
jgi:hypothetical protein